MWELTNLHSSRANEKGQTVEITGIEDIPAFAGWTIYFNATRAPHYTGKWFHVPEHDVDRDVSVYIDGSYGDKVGTG